MNIAIVVGVSKYSDAKDNLPGSKNDAEAVNLILQKTDKFDKILYINNEENSAQTKELITNAILECKDNTIDELFFYYSGHGEFVKDEFFYVLSDFEIKKRKQTSLQNSEIDDLIRTLRPKLVIKVIDACQSGTSYIKESGIVNKYFNDSSKEFKNCYFFSSSLNSQSSYADEQISYFTLSFINALHEHKSNEIRYKDIMDFISDEFDGNSDQTPHFVIQAELTEKFCKINSDLKEYITNLVLRPNSEETKDSDGKSLSLTELVKLNAREYTNKQGAIAAVNKIKDIVTSFKLSDTLNELYNLKVEFSDDYSSISKLETIDNWLSDKGQDFFVSSIYESSWNEFMNSPQDIIVGFDLKLDVPYKAIIITLNSKYPNIYSYNISIIYFLSKKLITFFYYSTNYIEKNWDDRVLNIKDIKWFTSDENIGDIEEVENEIVEIFETIQGKIEDQISDKFQPDDDNSEDDLPF